MYNKWRSLYPKSIKNSYKLIRKDRQLNYKWIEDTLIAFHNRGPMTNKHVNRCSAKLVRKAMLIKTTVKYLYIFKERLQLKDGQYQCYWGSEVTESLRSCWWEHKLRKPLRKLFDSMYWNLRDAYLRTKQVSSYFQQKGMHMWTKLYLK